MENAAKKTRLQRQVVLRRFFLGQDARLGGICFSLS